MTDRCPWCGMPKNSHVPAWDCGSFPPYGDEGDPIQSKGCAEITRLNTRIEKLERVAQVAVGLEVQVMAVLNYWADGNFTRTDELIKSLTFAILAMKESLDSLEAT